MEIDSILYILKSRGLGASHNNIVQILNIYEIVIKENKNMNEPEVRIFTKVFFWVPKYNTCHLIATLVV